MAYNGISTVKNPDSPFEQNLDTNGVDLDVLNYYLAMTPTERFEAYERQIKVVFQFWRENGIEPDFECEYA